MERDMIEAAPTSSQATTPNPQNPETPAVTAADRVQANAGAAASLNAGGKEKETEKRILTDDEVKFYSDKLEQFRKILNELVSEDSKGSEIKVASEEAEIKVNSKEDEIKGDSEESEEKKEWFKWFKLPGNPFAGLLRYLQQEPGFEDTVAKYARLLPLITAPSAIIYSEMALIGITALKTRQMRVAKTIYEELRYQSSTSAALLAVMRGVGIAVAVFLFVLISVPVIGMLVLMWFPGAINIVNMYDTLIHVGAAFIFGCLGSGVSLLLRLDEFAGLFNALYCVSLKQRGLTV
jgi:hypothetical protein